MRVSEIRVKRIRVNQGFGVYYNINSALSKPSSEGTLAYGSCNAVARCAPKTYNKSRAIRANASHLLQLHSLWVIFVFLKAIALDERLWPDGNDALEMLFLCFKDVLTH